MVIIHHGQSLQYEIDESRRENIHCSSPPLKLWDTKVNPRCSFSRRHLISLPDNQHTLPAAGSMLEGIGGGYSEFSKVASNIFEAASAWDT